MSPRAKVIAAVMLTILTICVFFLVLIAHQNRQHIKAIIDGKSDSVNLVVTSIIDQIHQHYSLRIKSFVSYETSQSKEEIVQAFARQDRARLQTLSRPFFDLLRTENPSFTSMGWILPNNIAFLRVHLPDFHGQEDITRIRPDIVAVNQDHRQHSGFIPGGYGLLYSVAQPVFYQGTYIGVVQMGIDAQSILATLAPRLESPVGLAVPNQKYRTAWPENSTGISGPTHTSISTDQTLLSKLLPGIDWTLDRQSIRDKGKMYVISKASLLTDFKGEEMAGLFVVLDITAETDKGTALLLSASLLCLLLLGLSFVILYFSYGALVQKIVDLNHSLRLSNRQLEKRIEERTQKLLKEIEERKNTEAKLQKAEKMEAIGLMAGGVAHDLNNILSGVVSYPELLLMQLPETSPLRHPLTAIHESGLRAAAVVADLLTVARSAARVREITQLNTIVEEYLASPEAEKLSSLHGGVEIATNLDPKLANILCSPIHVRKCLMNLVINAAEALGESGLITISTASQTIKKDKTDKGILPGEYVALRVSDNGPGIPTRHLEHIFEPFYTKKTLGHSGTGIGLTVVWNAMQDHNGHVMVESSDQGTVFTLLFPATSAQRDPDIETVELKNLWGNNEHILVVDDEPQQRDIASQILKLLGYRVSTVESGEKAIEFMALHTAELVILDMLMDPGLNGRRTYEEIIKRQPGQRAIIASGFAEGAEVTKAAGLGVAAFIKKPYTMTELGMAVKNALRHS